jgi:hypothetical protein
MHVHVQYCQIFVISFVLIDNRNLITKNRGELRCSIPVSSPHDEPWSSAPRPIILGWDVLRKRTAYIVLEMKI